MIPHIHPLPSYWMIERTNNNDKFSSVNISTYIRYPLLYFTFEHSLSGRQQVRQVILSAHRLHHQHKADQGRQADKREFYHAAPLKLNHPHFGQGECSYSPS